MKPKQTTKNQSSSQESRSSVDDAFDNIKVLISRMTILKTKIESQKKVNEELREIRRWLRDQGEIDLWIVEMAENQKMLDDLLDEFNNFVVTIDSVSWS